MVFADDLQDTGAKAGLLNGRPRQTLGWRTPNEALAEEISKFRNGVALDS
jgi:IS30 family transposase